VITINDLLAASLEEKTTAKKEENYLKDKLNASNSNQHYWI